MAGTPAKGTSTRKPSTSTTRRSSGAAADDDKATDKTKDDAATDTGEGAADPGPQHNELPNTQTPAPTGLEPATEHAHVPPGPVHNADPGDSTPAGGEIKPDDNPDPSEDPAAAVKAARMNMRVTQPSHPGGELTEEQRVQQLGISSHSVGGARTLLGGTPEPRIGVGAGPGYEIAETDAYAAWVPKNAKQPACVRVWAAGQRVRKDVLTALAGHTAETAKDAPVMSDETYTELASFL